MIVKSMAAAAVLMLALPNLAIAAPNDRAGVQPQWTNILNILRDLKTKGRPRNAVENVSCTGANGLKITYRTSSAAGRPLEGAITVNAGGRPTQISDKQITSYLNEDAQVIIAAYKKDDAEPTFSLNLELISATPTIPDVVATLEGEATLSSAGGKPISVRCTITQSGTGMPNPQPGSGNIQVKCVDIAAPASALPVVSFEVARNPSARLVSDLNETRSSTDTETLPAFLTAQYLLRPAAIRIELDDGSAAGTLIAKLTAEGRRLPPPGSGLESTPLYAVWSGTYERFDAGRQIKIAVQCVGR